MIDGEVAQAGTMLRDWEVRTWVQEDGTFLFDWIMDDGNGGYSESDEFFESVDEAMRSLGVR